MTSKPELFESELHEAMRLNDKSLRAELRSAGLDPNSEALALRAMISFALENATIHDLVRWSKRRLNASLTGLARDRDGVAERETETPNKTI